MLLSLKLVLHSFDLINPLPTRLKSLPVRPVQVPLLRFLLFRLVLFISFPQSPSLPFKVVLKVFNCGLLTLLLEWSISGSRVEMAAKPYMMPQDQGLIHDPFLLCFAITGLVIAIRMQVLEQN